MDYVIHSFDNTLVLGIHNRKDKVFDFMRHKLQSQGEIDKSQKVPAIYLI